MLCIDVCKEPTRCTDKQCHPSPSLPLSSSSSPAICRVYLSKTNTNTLPLATMYPNPMQQPQQGGPMPRPHTMMNAGPMPQPNTAVGMQSMRPMVASSPMQASMLQQPGQPPMMVRPGGGSPYGVVNRAPLYDKNKRSVYSNDLRQPPMVQPGPPPQQMAYANAPGPHPSMMPNAVPPMGGGSMRQ